MGFAILSAASSCAKPSFFAASGTDLSPLSAAISFLICSGGSVNFLVCGSMPDMIIVIFVNASSYWARLAKPFFLATTAACASTKQSEGQKRREQHAQKSPTPAHRVSVSNERHSTVLHSLATREIAHRCASPASPQRRLLPPVV